MNLPFNIAKRYFLSTKKNNAVNIISWISLLGVSFGSAALVIVLSVFNGFETLINTLYNTFDPPIKVMPATGKFFELDSLSLDQIKSIEYVDNISLTIEEKALIRYAGNEHVITLKGVDTLFHKINSFNNSIIEGDYLYPDIATNNVVLGKGVSYYLGLGIESQFNQVQLFVPKKGLHITNPDKAFHKGFVQPIGVFSIQADFDTKYVLSSLKFAQELFERPTQWSAIEIGLTENADEEKVISKIKSVLGGNFLVKNSAEQHAFLFKIMQTERLAVIGIFTFILLIASFNLIGSLTMLMLDKKDHIATLWNLGMRRSDISKIFRYEGLLISVIGAGLGLILGSLICLGQAKFGWLTLGNKGSFIVNAYPVELNYSDLVFTFLIVLIIGYFASLIPARRLSKKFTSYIS